MRKLTYKGEDLTVALGPDDLVTCCHGQILIPFPNRIEGGEYTFEGKTYSLPIDEHDRNTAIHGYGYRSFWKLISLAEDAVTSPGVPPTWSATRLIYMSPPRTASPTTACI